MTLTRAEILAWLRETDHARLEDLWARADSMRRRCVGDAVHRRGLIEISNHCVRSCCYCGLRAGNSKLSRYRMSDGEILSAAKMAAAFGYGTVVLQSGEDPGLETDRIVALIRRIKSDTPLAVTLSLGEREPAELRAWREAGADRYLLRFETADRELFHKIHPDLPGKPSERLALLEVLRSSGYEVGSGIMVGIPGQSFASLARDLRLFQDMDLDMIGVGPYLPHPETPLGSGWKPRVLRRGEQAPATAEMTCKVMSLTRLLCPESNIPSTTALATIDPAEGRELGLKRGANVVMPNLTPVRYRASYEIYPGKACIAESADACHGCLERRIRALGRQLGSGPGCRKRAVLAESRS
jgi:biotin synthase